MKKILIFSLTYHPFIGGAEVAIKEITDRVIPADYEFHMITPRFDSRLPRVERVGNIIIHRIGFGRPGITTDQLHTFPVHYNKHLYQVSAPFYALRLHARHRFDGVWAMMAQATGVPAAIFKRFRPRVPYLLTLQEGDPPAQIERTMRPLQGWFKRSFVTADALQAISTFLASWGVYMGFRGTPDVIPNGVDTARFAEAAPRDIGKKEGEIYLISSSRLVHKNALDDVIRALRFLPPTVHFLILGIGLEEEGLRKLAQECGVETRVRFEGFVSHDQLPAYLHASDIFIRPSRSEGMGNSFIEAMAAGLPVIATQEGGIADFLFDAKLNPDKEPTGWAVDRDSPEQIAGAVKDILAHPDQAAHVVANAKKLVSEKYDWNLIATQMKAVFDKVFSEPFHPL